MSFLATRRQAIYLKINVLVFFQLSIMYYVPQESFLAFKDCWKANSLGLGELLYRGSHLETEKRHRSTSHGSRSWHRH